VPRRVVGLLQTWEGLLEGVTYSLTYRIEIIKSIIPNEKYYCARQKKGGGGKK